ncbi:hypothetical protein [Sediminicoccus rosea]|jgi:hypothetical protein|uniref:Uncharacterized protein n=1 Tax=Sediminicoccus rosea TaxID=1225128 RepID=A0ABZ0PML7_9PROT|nr:hypothetical protein [Sediminicoccus rosea]WPB86974.1 hypothetical protein R9Z33_08875 [Sediminicoccus rosea]
MLRATAVLGLTLGLFAGTAAQAQTGPGRGDCISNGMVRLGAFTAEPVVTERGVDPNAFAYAVTLRATQPLGSVIVILRIVSSAVMTSEVELPVGQDVRVALGRRSGPRIPDAELRSSLRVACTLA